MPPPRNPCTARHRIICSMVEAKPHRKLAMVNPQAEIANSNRVPSARDMNPDSGMAITSAIRYEVWTHDTSLELADNPAWISDSDAETTWMSRIAMNMPKTMIRNAISRRGWIRSDGAAAASMDGVTVASVIVLQIRIAADRARNLLRMDHLRRIEVGIAVGILGALAGIDGGVDRHARAQQILFRNILRNADADRQPLHDLGEVAGGVVRRQQREHSTCRRRNAVDNSGELALTIGVHLDRHRLAGADALELGFLEI